MPSRRFEAYTDCPRCGHLDVHWLRPARVRRKFTDWSDTITTEMVEIRDWGSPVVRTVSVVESPRTNPESDYEVIRTCASYAAKWGEK